MFDTDHDPCSAFPKFGAGEQSGILDPQCRWISTPCRSIEQRDNSRQRGRPVAVSGSWERSVVAAAT